MRILVINHRDWLNPRAGGVEEVVRQTTTRWAAAGHEVTLLVSEFKEANERELSCEGVRILRRGFEETFNWTVPLLHRRLFAKADVIVEHLSKVACLLPWFTHKPVVGYYYHLFGGSLYGNVFWPVALYVRLMEKLAIRVYGGCPAVVISQSTAGDLARHGMSTERMRVVYCGMNLDLFQPRKPEEKTAYPSIVWVGRVRKTKGVALAIEAFERVVKALPDAQLTIIGTGDYAEELRGMIIAKGLQGSVTMTGYLSEQELRDHLQRAWVLTYPSPKEGWGLCVIEAGACGTPSVASDSPGLREAVKDGVTGFLVLHGDVAALSEKLLLLLRDKVLLAKMSSAALERARQFSWERTAAESLVVVESAACGRA